ncbi:uncharacterized protein J3D65DRAFT_664264 [Phyllosticta citribraziliensis]|uniref:Ubiquitin-like protease family profile domain-containing protein n=1 Tax=Phyllosticta citribraziliensis TaxID=989973 RepID=A0ABR1MB30_9PEZI
MSELSEKKTARNPQSIDRLMEAIGPQPDIGTFSPRRKSQSKDVQTATEYGSQRRITQLPKSLKRPDAIEEVHSRPARNSRIESEKSLSFSTTSPAKPLVLASKPRRWEIREFSVRSTKIKTDGTLALEYNLRRSRFEVVNRDGPIVQGTGHLFIDTGNIAEVSYSSSSPWRVQIIDKRRDHWQKFEIVAKNDLVDFLEYVQEMGLRKLEEKHSREMEALFQTPYPFVSSNPPGLDEEAALLQARTRGRDETPHQHEPDHRTDVRRERPAKLVSQMRPEIEKAYEDLEPAWRKLRRNDLRQTRSTARVADDEYTSTHRRVKEEEAALTPRPPKLSEDPGFGPEWPHPVVFPSTGRYQSQVSFSDLQRLEDGEFWNDSVISFCMAWYLHEAKEKIGFDETRIHIFSTYFCTKLWEAPTTNGINYGNVVRWTSKIDLFSRDFVIVPVNDAEHWHLAIIVNMKNISKSLDERKRLDEEATASDQTAEGDEVQPQSELKQNLFKTLGAGKSGKLSAKSNNRLNSPAKAAVKKTSSIDPDCTTVIVFDSLGATHPKTVKTLKQYIIAEAKAKLGLALTARDIQTINAKDIPLQPNYYDCGVFVCGYFEKFMQDPDGFVKKIMYKEMDRVQDWPNLDPLNIRRSTLMTLLTLQQGQYRERKEVKKKKKKEEAEKQNSATPKESSPAKASTDSSDDNAQPVTHPPQPPTELSTSVWKSAPDRETAPESQEKKHLRTGSPQVVIPKEVPTPSTDPPAQAAAVGTPSKAPEQTASKHLSKRSNYDDVRAFNADRPSKKPRLEERKSESPSKKPKSPSPKSQTPKEAPKAKTLSAAEGSREEPVEIDRSAVQERPSSNRRARELRTEIPESPPQEHAESVVYPDGRSTSLHDNQTAHGHRTMRRVRRTHAELKELFDNDNDEVIEVQRTPPQPEYQSDDDEFIEDPSEVDLVRHPQHHDYHQHQWQADGGTTGVYGDSEMQESQQPEGLEDWTTDLARHAHGQGEPKTTQWSPPPKDFRSKNYRPDLHRSEDYSLDMRNGFRQHEVISLTDDDDDE